MENEPHTLPARLAALLVVRFLRCAKERGTLLIRACGGGGGGHAITGANGIPPIGPAGRLLRG